MDIILAIALFVHVLSAIAAFGPSFTFPIIGAAGGREPVHGNFALRLTELIESRLLMVGWVVQPVSGIVIIWAAGIDFFAPGSRWLVSAIIIYAIAIAIAYFIQLPTLKAMIELTSRPPAIGTAPAAAAGGPGAAPAGPPPEFLALVTKSRRTGMLLTLLLVIIIYLMVVKPVV